MNGYYFVLAYNLCHIGSVYHSNIKFLDLSHNNITRISPGFFKPAEISLIHLYLGHNAIRVLLIHFINIILYLLWFLIINV